MWLTRQRGEWGHQTPSRLSLPASGLPIPLICRLDSRSFALFTVVHSSSDLESSSKISLILPSLALLSGTGPFSSSMFTYQRSIRSGLAIASLPTESECLVHSRSPTAESSLADEQRHLNRNVTAMPNPWEALLSSDRDEAWKWGIVKAESNVQKTMEIEVLSHGYTSSMSCTELSELLAAETISCAHDVILYVVSSFIDETFKQEYQSTTLRARPNPYCRVWTGCTIVVVPLLSRCPRRDSLQNGFRNISNWESRRNILKQSAGECHIFMTLSHQPPSLRNS